MKAVVYSLDAYIAAVIAILSVVLLLSYSGMEEDYFSYYQAKMFSIDGLKVLEEKGLLYEGEKAKTEMEGVLDVLIPKQYAYKLMLGGDVVVERGNVDEFAKAKASTKLVIPIRKECNNPYNYQTCQGTGSICSPERMEESGWTGCEESYKTEVYELVVAI